MKTKINALVVDDSMEFTSSVKEYFKNNAVINVVDVISDGEKVVPYICEHQNDIDIIIMDLIMPGKDGLAILDDLEKTVSINMDSLFNKIEKEESQKLSFGMKALLALSSFLAFKNNKNILGTLLTSYLSYKVIEELISSKKNKYLDLCNDYINILEKYMDDTLNIEKELLKNLDNIDELESELKTKYKEYLDEAEFKNIFKMISNIKSIVNRSLDDIDKTKNHIDKNIDNGKVKIKELEA